MPSTEDAQTANYTIIEVNIICLRTYSTSQFCLNILQKHCHPDIPVFILQILHFGMMHAPPPNPTHNYWVTNMVSSSTTTMSPTGFSSEGEEAEETPTSSIGPPRKKKHTNSKYQSEWSHKYSIKCSGRGETFAYCSVCNVDFSVAGGGVFQVKRHCQSKKHSSRAKELNHHVKIDSLVTHQAQDQVTHAELYFARVYQVTPASVIRLLKQFNLIF